MPIDWNFTFKTKKNFFQKKSHVMFFINGGVIFFNYRFLKHEIFISNNAWLSQNLALFTFIDLFYSLIKILRSDVIYFFKVYFNFLHES